jgi:porphobilinogen synthase
MATYPTKRLRRLRYNPIVRDLVRETTLSKDDLIYPMFVIHGENIKMKLNQCQEYFNSQLKI